MSDIASDYVLKAGCSKCREIREMTGISRMTMSAKHYEETHHIVGPGPGEEWA